MLTPVDDISDASRYIVTSDWRTQLVRMGFFISFPRPNQSWEYKMQGEYPKSTSRYWIYCSTPKSWREHKLPGYDDPADFTVHSEQWCNVDSVIGLRVTFQCVVPYARLLIRYVRALTDKSVMPSDLIMDHLMNRVLDLAAEREEHLLQYSDNGLIVSVNTGEKLKISPIREPHRRRIIGYTRHL